GEREELTQPGPHPGDQVPDRLLTMRGSHQIVLLGEPGEGLGPHLRRPAAEPAVGRLQGIGNLDHGSRHRRRLAQRELRAARLTVAAARRRCLIGLRETDRAYYSEAASGASADSDEICGALLASISPNGSRPPAARTATFWCFVTYQ